MPPTTVSPIQAANLVVLDTEMPPRSVFSSDLLAAAPQALVKDTILVNPSDGPCQSSKKITGPSLNEQHSSASSEDHPMSVSEPALVQATTKEILNPVSIVHASPSHPEERSLTVLSTRPALAQITIEEILDSGSMEYTSSSLEGRCLSFPPPALAQRAAMSEEAMQEEGAKGECDFEYTSFSSHHVPAPEAAEPAHTTSMEEEGVDEEFYMGYHPFDAEDHPVPQISLPEYDSNDPLWMYIDTWLNQLPNSRIPDPFVHVPAKYHHSLETFLNSVLPPSLPSHQIQESGMDSPSNNGPSPPEVHPNTQDPSAVLRSSTPTPMTLDDDESFIFSAPPGPWNTMWVIDEDDDLDAPYQQGWMPCNQDMAERVLDQVEVDYDDRFADDVQHFDDSQSDEE
ncbi:hypothetical protein BGZ88_005368 [Linnemannia elongata]|nr:hypothetical protein BGZ88_005368 [Linnemannia elongata]